MQTGAAAKTSSSHTRCGGKEAEAEARETFGIPGRFETAEMVKPRRAERGQAAVIFACHGHEDMCVTSSSSSVPEIGTEIYQGTLCNPQKLYLEDHFPPGHDLDVDTVGFYRG